MACPDRVKDARIIAEIERRKAMTSVQLKDASSEFEEYLHVGSMMEILNLGFKEGDIFKIQQVEESTWRITLKTESHESNKGKEG